VNKLSLGEGQGYRNAIE